MQAQIHLFHLLLILCGLVCSTSHAEEPPEWEVTPEISELIETIKRHEKSLVNYGYDVCSFARHVVFDGKQWQPIGEELDPFVHDQIPTFDAKILWDIRNNWYCVRWARFMHGPNGRGEVEYSLLSDEFSENDISFMRERFSLTTVSKPDWKQPAFHWPGASKPNPRGFVAKPGSPGAVVQNDSYFLDWPGPICGAGWASPHIYTLHEHPMALSELLEKRIAEKHEIIFQQTEDGHWDIHFGLPYGFRVLYAPEPGRVEQLIWGACVDRDIKAPLTFDNMTYQRTANVTYEEEEDRIPSRVVIVEAWGKSPGYRKGRKEIGQVLTLTNRRCNEELKPEDFRIQFQPGTRVTDYEREVKERTKRPFRSFHELLGIPQRQQP